MRKIMGTLLAVLILGFISCRDDEREVLETKLALEQIKIVEEQTEQIVRDIENSAEELMKEIKELERELNNL